MTMVASALSRTKSQFATARHSSISLTTDFGGRTGRAVREVLGQPDGVRHGRAAPLRLWVVVVRDSKVLDSPRTAGSQGNNRPERQLLQVFGSVIRDNHFASLGWGKICSSI